MPMTRVRSFELGLITCEMAVKALVSSGWAIEKRLKKIAMRTIFTMRSVSGAIEAVSKGITDEEQGMNQVSAIVLIRQGMPAQSI